jgi:hypothetical protein
MSRLAEWIVGLSARTLPTGAIRERYLAEFLSELYDLTPGQQLRHAFGVLAQSGSLRMAVTNRGMLGWEGTPVICRLLLHHQWRLQRTEDGGRYRHCRRCGKDDGGRGGLGVPMAPP